MGLMQTKAGGDGNSLLRLDDAFRWQKPGTASTRLRGGMYLR